jgi:hypothetical protein
VGEAQEWLFEPSFNRAVKVQASDERITSDAGLLLLREADHRLGLTEHLAAQLVDPRRPDKIRYQLVELLRERVYALALGYAAQDDADRLAHDPAMKLAVWNRPGEAALEERLASQPTQSRLLDTLAHHGPNRAALRDALAECCARHLRASGGAGTPKGSAARRITLDVDSFPIQVHGQQPGAAYNGHYRDTVYHPLVASYSVAGSYDSMQEGHRLGNGFVHAILRQGQVHTAQGVLRFVEETLRLAGPLGYVVDLRIDAGYVHGAVLDALTARKLRFLGRIKANPVLDQRAAPHLTRPVGRPPQEGYEKLVELGPYQAESWKHPQRLVLVVVDRPDPKTGQLNLLPNYFFLIVGWSQEELSAEEALAHYRQRGTFEDRLGEFQQAIGPHLSHADFRENEAVLRLALLAFNLASALRIEYEDRAGSCFDLARFQRDVLKAGARVAKHARRLIVCVAQVVRPFWEELVRCLRRWKLPPRFPAPRGPRPRHWLPPPRHAFASEVRRL